jgi:hypothetical protein
MQITVKDALNQLDANAVQLFVKVMAHGSMSLDIQTTEN